METEEERIEISTERTPIDSDVSQKSKKKKKTLLKDGEGFDGDDEYENGQTETAEEFFQYSDKPKAKLTNPNSEKRSKRWFRKMMKHKKTVFIALFLFIVGLVFLVLGIHDITVGSKTRATAFFVIAALTVIPGGYQTYYIYRILRGDSDYRFSHIPYATSDGDAIN